MCFITLLRNFFKSNETRLLENEIEFIRKVKLFCETFENSPISVVARGPVAFHLDIKARNKISAISVKTYIKELQKHYDIKDAFISIAYNSVSKSRRVLLWAVWPETINDEIFAIKGN